MGGHRIDLVRKLNAALTVAEAIAIVAALHLGYGLFVMATVMAASEILYIACCFLISRHVLPQIEVKVDYITKSVVKELIRFAGSYQLVGLLEVLYAAILPVAILRSFGDNAAGVYALATRAVNPAMMLQESFLQPILSGGTMVYASGSTDWMRRLLTKSFKVTLLITLPPLAFVGVFGSTMILAWTGQSDPLFPGALCLVSIAVLFQAFCRLQLIMYRVSGRALLDNLRQVLGILTLLGVTVFARKLGFYGVLSGLALSELIGMLFMFLAMEHTYHSFEAKALIPDTLKITLATVAIIGAGAIALRMPLPSFTWESERIVAFLRLGVVAAACLVITWPALILTRSITKDEGLAMLQAIVPNRWRIDPLARS
jgi:O-antigen/teichoic acid export membrane protein